MDIWQYLLAIVRVAVAVLSSVAEAKAQKSTPEDGTDLGERLSYYRLPVSYIFFVFSCCSSFLTLNPSAN
jgi:hypothetical protein